MQRVSKKAIWMWLAEFLAKPIALAILFFWFISGAAFLYLAFQSPLENKFLLGQDLDKIYKIGVIFDKWLFLGFSISLVFLILSAASNAFYKYWSLSYELEESAFKIVKGVYKKEESFIPYKNVESIDIRVGSAERFFGLSSLLIFTSGAGDKNNPDSAEGYIEGLKYDEAVILKDELLKRIK
ncbi:MAG: PH domain-containing protein [Candidatus Azambacteria bacterium]|nr:PH domain-containing protein [Candidatus Azambacteria bacterium]